WGILRTRPRRWLALQDCSPSVGDQTHNSLQKTHQARIYQAAGYIYRRREVTIMNRLEYCVLIEPLPLEDGGGFLATVPDLPGCMSDGETPLEAIANVQDAIA